jgi:hypothetical protein
VGVIGTKDTTAVCSANVRSWDHRRGTTAGAVDMLAHCKLFVGTDTGVSHLAALMDTTTLLFCKQVYHALMTTEIHKASAVPIEEMDEQAWDDPRRILQRVIAKVEAITESNKPHHAFHDVT